MELSDAPLPAARERERRLDERLASLGSLLVAYSGGVDSAYLAARAHRVLGARMLAVTADSESLAAEQRAQAGLLARAAGFAHEWLATRELDDPRYARNAPDRCYFCKHELFSRLLPLARERGLAHVGYGIIVDDLGEHRPGHRAALEAGVQGPLADAGLGKADVRALSRAMGLIGYDRPASPCLASRIAHGTPVSRERLGRVDAAETAVRALGFGELRVRDMGEHARVELAPAELDRLEPRALRERVISSVRAAGFSHVEIDPRGYRRGALSAPAAPASPAPHATPPRGTSD